MGTKLDFGSLYMETEDGLVQIMEDCVCEDLELAGPECDDTEIFRTRSVTDECSGTITIKSNLHIKKGHRVFSHNQFVLRLLGYSNNWLKMHGYPMVRSVPLRGRRTRSKKKK